MCGEHGRKPRKKRIIFGGIGQRGKNRDQLTEDFRRPSSAIVEFPKFKPQACRVHEAFDSNLKIRGEGVLLSRDGYEYAAQVAVNNDRDLHLGTDHFQESAFLI